MESDVYEVVHERLGRHILEVQKIAAHRPGVRTKELRVYLRGCRGEEV